MKIEFEQTINPEALKRTFGGKVENGKWIAPELPPPPGPLRVYMRRGNKIYFRNELNKGFVELSEKLIQNISPVKYGTIINIEAKNPTPTNNETAAVIPFNFKYPD